MATELAVRLCRRFASLPEAAPNSSDAASLDALKGVPALFPAGHDEQLAHWTAFARDVLGGDDGRAVAAGFAQLDSHLAMRSFLVGYQLTAADLAVWAALHASPVFQKNLKTNKAGLEELFRWYAFVGANDFVADEAAKSKPAPKAAGNAKAAAAKETKKEDKPAVAEGGDEYSIDVPHAVDGQVVTRFAPEPSGYLHIGHAKAVLVSHYIAKRYNGKFYVRFDDTNPSKEKMEFEQSIKEDLLLMGVEADKTTHTSDYFDVLYEKALDLIKRGLAYADDTDMETMRYERGEGIKSKCRDQPIEETLRRFEEMRQGTPFGLTCALRAKISVDDPNKAMRDPVIYRCNVADPHHITGTKWKVYPTYDFAAPVVDSLEGITHALRANEYRDRNPQYNWFFNALEIRPVFIFDYSKVNFIYTLLSKRKLKWFVEEGLVDGWDDPRFPTIRGIRRRGMTIEALRTYILQQGASQKVLDLEWDKIWVTNKKVIDPVAPRYTAIVTKNMVPVDVVGETFEPYAKEAPKHKKNPDVGMKQITFSPQFWLEEADAKDSQPGEEVTLMDWGNIIFDEVIRKEDGTVERMTCKLNLSGDFKKTKRKLTWISRLPAAGSNVETPAVVLLDYDYLITKKKIEEDDEVTDCLTPVTQFTVDAIGDRNLVNLKKGDIIQFERKGYFICDGEFDPADPKKPIRMITIPDGSDKMVASKHAMAAGEPAKGPVNAAKGGKGSKEGSGGADKKEKAPKAAKATAKAPEPMSVAERLFPTKSISMYRLEPIMTDISIESAKLSMYGMDSVYGADFEAASTAAPMPSATSTPAPAQANGDAKAAPAKAEAAAAQNPELALFAKLDIRIGKVVDVKRHPDADSLYVETIDAGEAAPRTVVSGLVKFLQPEELQDKLVVLLCNLKPASMRGIKSAAMVLCASDADHTKVELLIPPEGSKPGDRVVVEGQQGEPEEQLNPKKKVFETIQPDITTTSDLIVAWKGMPLVVSGKGVVRTSSIPAAVVK